jgi:hypothetical protein
MPLAAIPAVIGASLIGGGASVATSLINKNKSGGSSAAGVTTPIDPSLTALNTKLGSLADYQLQQGQNLLPKALDTLRQPEDYFRTLLSGNRNAVMGLLGPQINTITDRGAQQQNAISQLLPRGGRLNDRMGAQSTADTAQINDALLGARPAAANSLTNIGQLYGQLGSGLLSGSGNSLATSLQSLLGQRGQDVTAYLQKYQQQQENDRSLGQGIGSMLGILLGPGGILNKGGSSGGGGSLPILPTNWPLIIKSLG